MKRYERIALLLFIGTGLAVVSIAAYKIYSGMPAGRWVSTAGYIIAISGLLQLDISGLFYKIMTEYGDETRYPYGPPSRIVREIIANPDQPIREHIRALIFFRTRTGFELVLLGTALQAIGMWL